MIKKLPVFLLTLALLGCAVEPSPPPPVVATLPALVTEAASPGVPTATPTRPAPTLTMPATIAPMATVSPTPALTLTPTPAPNPMSIEMLRARAYPASPITLEQELDRGANYRRFYASYQSDGLKIYALLTIPDGEMPPGGWPAIVFNHGYIPPQVYKTTERYVAYVDSLAQAGYVVFRIDYRGHDQSEGQPRGAYGDPGYTVDVLNALSAISHFEQVNPLKVGMWGHSMGGFLTLRAMVIAQQAGAGIIKAGVIWGGVVGSYPDMMSKWRRGPQPTPTPPPYARNWRSNWIKQYGTPEENPAFWASVSANSYLSDLSGPVQLDHSIADEEVPVVFSETLAEQIRQAGGTVELYTYLGDNHNISQNFSTAMSHTIEFFDRYLK